MQIARLITALYTPFLDGEVDIPGLQWLIRKQLEGGAEGILVLGTTGEAPTLTHEERRAVIAAAVQTLEGKLPLFVGTGTNCTATTVALTAEAEALGADAALIITPYYSCPTEAGVIAHFKAIAEQTSLPLCIYHHPKRTGCRLSAAAIAKIAAIPQVIGIKEASGDVDLIASIIHETDENFRVWTGNDTQILPLLALGGEGLFSVASNLIPQEMQALIAAASGGDGELARREFYRLLPLIQALFVEVNPIPIKAAAHRCGMPAGPCRLPLAPLSDQNLDDLEKMLEAYGMLNPVGGHAW